MKHAKKLASLLLALVMVMGLATTAFAADKTGTIIVANPQADQNYTAYKIFDVTYDEAKEAYSYTISNTSEWFNVVAEEDGDGNVTSKVNGLTLVKAFSDDSICVVTKGSGFSAASFANMLKANIAGKSGAALTVSNGEATASNLELGYYFVTSTTGALCNLTTTDPTVTIYDKNDVPFDKVDDKESVEVGEVVNYTITGKVPDTTGFEIYKYQITDTMSAGLTFNDDVKVYIGGEELTDRSKYTLKTGADAENKTFVLDIEVMKLSVGAKIEVKYSATVNAGAVAKVEKNHATLEYSNDPTDTTKTKTREDEETVYSAKIVIDKYAKQDDENDKSKKLAGAEFVLYKEVTTKGADESTKMYYKYTPATETEEAKVEWVEDRDNATKVTTDTNGTAKFSGLKDGIYYLEEIAAPAGYNLLKDPVRIVIEGKKDNAGTITETSLTHTEGVANNTGAELPSTGGMGTTIFYILGAVLVVGAGILLVVRRRMSTEE